MLISLARFSFNHLLKLASFDEGGRAGALFLLLFGLLLKHLDLVLETGEDEGDHGRAAVQSTACVHPLIEGPDLRLVSLELHSFGVFGHFLSLQKTCLHLIRQVAARWLRHADRDILKLGVLALNSISVQLPLSDVKRIGTEQTVDLFFKLHKLRGVEGVLEDLGGENGQSFEEIDVWAFVRLNL